MSFLMCLCLSIFPAYSIQPYFDNGKSCTKENEYTHFAHLKILDYGNQWHHHLAGHCRR